jgi:hypothetical protein
MSNTCLLLTATPWWYWIVAVVVSLYHGYRGFTLQKLFMADQKEGAARTLPNGASTPTWKWSPFEAVVVRSLFDGMFYFLCSAVWFLCLSALVTIYDSVKSLDQVSGGTAAVLSLLGVGSVVGIVGQLPYLILLGKLPK